MRVQGFSRRFVLLNIVVMGLFGAGAFSAHAQSNSDRILKEGKITIGIHNRAPWGFKTDDGGVAGLQPDLLKAILSPIGVKQVDYVILEWNALLPSLLSKRIDAIATGMQITPQRCEIVIFSNPDLTIKDSLAVLPGNPKNIHSLADAGKSPDFRLGVIRGSTAELERAVKAGVPRERIVPLADYTALVSALLGGRIDGIDLNPASINELLKDPNVKGKLERAASYVGLIENGREFAAFQAILFRPEDARLRDLYNEGLAKRRADGTLRSIVLKYGFSESDIASESVTTKELCGANYR